MRAEPARKGFFDEGEVSGTSRCQAGVQAEVHRDTSWSMARFDEAERFHITTEAAHAQREGRTRKRRDIETQQHAATPPRTHMPRGGPKYGGPFMFRCQQS